MKKLILITFTVICCISIIPYKAYAIDMSVGATTWVAFGDRYDDVKENRERESNSYAFAPTFLFGPVMSVKLSDEFNLTFVYLYGKFEYKETFEGSIGLANQDIKSKAERNDSDIAINYNINNYFRAFAGIKYMSYKIDLSVDLAGDTYTNNSKHISLGPGFGFSGTLPVGYNFFLLGTVSGFYLFSKGETFKDYQIYTSSLLPMTIKVGYNEYGFNSTMAIAYYITPASMVISLGGRFQYFIVDYDNYRYFPINSITNKIYGVTLTATYNFSI